MCEDNIAVAIRVRPVIITEKKKKLAEQWIISGKEIYPSETLNREFETFTFGKFIFYLIIYTTLIKTYY